MREHGDDDGVDKKKLVILMKMWCVMTCDDVQEELDALYYQKGDKVKGDDSFDKVDVN